MEGVGGGGGGGVGLQFPEILGTFPAAAQG